MVCAATDATLCKSNRNCASAEYCALTSSDGFYDKPDVGTCMPLTKGVPYTYNNKKFLKSDNLMGSWWSVENWCKAKGMKLVSLADTGIDKDNLGDFFNNNGYCYGDREEKCENVDWTSIKEAFPDADYWWTRESYDACHAYLVTLLWGSRVDNDSRHHDGYVLCVEE